MSLGISIDSSLESNEEIRFKQKHRRLMQNLTKRYHFTYSEVEALMIIYYKIWKTGNNEKQAITMPQVEEVLHSGLDMTDQKMAPYILSAFSRGVSRVVTKTDWVAIMSLFLRGTLDEKIKYCFKTYCRVTMQERLLRNHVIKLLSNSLVNDSQEEDEESVKDFTDLVLKKMDVDRDGKISFEDFKATVKKDPFLLEAFGPCLPKRPAVHTFLSTFSKTIGKK